MMKRLLLLVVSFFISFIKQWTYILGNDTGWFKYNSYYYGIKPILPIAMNSSVFSLMHPCGNLNLFGCTHHGNELNDNGTKGVQWNIVKLVNINNGTRTFVWDLPAEPPNPARYIIIGY